jgi:hypothetical protein
MIEPRGHRQREDQAQDEERFDERERASSECEELEDVANPVESAAEKPPGPADEPDEESGAYRQARSLADGRPMLEHRRQPVASRAGQRKQDNGDEAAPDVVVECAQTLRHRCRERHPPPSYWFR